MNHIFQKNSSCGRLYPIIIYLKDSNNTYYIVNIGLYPKSINLGKETSNVMMHLTSPHRLL